MFCKNCGATIPDGVTKCPSCGKEIPATSNQGATQTSGADSIFKNNYKSQDGKLITGVCAGLAKKLGKTPWFVRAIFLIGGWIPILGWFLLGYYIVAAITWKFAD